MVIFLAAKQPRKQLIIRLSLFIVADDHPAKQGTIMTPDQFHCAVPLTLNNFESCNDNIFTHTHTHTHSHKHTKCFLALPKAKRLAHKG